MSESIGGGLAERLWALAAGVGLAALARPVGGSQEWTIPLETMAGVCALAAIVATARAICERRLERGPALLGWLGAGLAVSLALAQGTARPRALLLHVARRQCAGQLRNLERVVANYGADRRRTFAPGDRPWQELIGARYLERAPGDPGQGTNSSDNLVISASGGLTCKVHGDGHTRP